MGRFQTALSFFALRAEPQILLMPEIPYDKGVKDYYAALNQNPLQLLVRGIFEDSYQAELESDDDYFNRTGIRHHHQSPALDELCCFISLLVQHDAADEYWTQRSLVKKCEWKLFRRLADLSLAETGLTISCTRGDVDDEIRSFKQESAHA